MKVGNMVQAAHHYRCTNDIWGIVVEVGSHPDANNGPACRVKWFDGDDSIEWVKALKVISESR